MISYRTQKQILIGLATILGILALFLLGQAVLKPKPTCVDKKQNQGEDAIDCGGPCLPCELKDIKSLVIEKAYSLDYKLKGIDLVAEIFNPNTKYGLTNLTGYFILTNKEGTTLREDLDEPFYILPGENKMIVKIKALINEPNFKPESISFNLDSIISLSDWQKLPPAINNSGEVLELTGVKMKYTNSKQASPVNITADLINRSPLNFRRAFVDVLLCDKKTSKPLSFNQLYIDNIKAEEMQGLPTISWRQALPLGAEICYRKAHTDVFNKDNLY
ncbi:MAG: hypothetical protein NTX26_00965 [Candidatus Parcubacteria bacterium]|nr:hypothetical protein [Candidatus Parcubacteria bacterium]